MKAFDFNRFLNVARWDLTINRKFYIRQLVIIAGCVLVPIIYKYLVLLANYKLWSSVGIDMAQEQDIVAVSGYFVFIGWAAYVLMSCYMFHNLVTKQARINELTLPATNLERFLWHAGGTVIGTTLIFFVSVALADLLHVILGWAILGQTEFQSLTKATFDISPTFRLTNEIGQAEGIWGILCWLFAWLMGVNFNSTFALGSAYKYKHTFGYMLLFHILWNLALLFVGAAVIGIFATQYFENLIDFLDSFSPNIVFLVIDIILAAVLCFIWWLTYRLYCRAQITTRRNP